MAGKMMTRRAFRKIAQARANGEADILRLRIKHSKVLANWKKHLFQLFFMIGEVDSRIEENKQKIREKVTRKRLDKVNEELKKKLENHREAMQDFKKTYRMVSQDPLRYDYDAFITKAEKKTLTKLRMRWQAETKKSVCAEIFDTNFYFSHGPYIDADALYIKAR